MKNLKSHFRFNRQERSGIFFLLLIIVSLQIGYFFFRDFKVRPSGETLVVDNELQAQIDSLRQAALQKDSVKIYPFNPNFITDYKGYVLGMSTEEIDRLHAFRKEDRFANSAQEFQQVTQVSDSLLDVISPHFKFPEWTQKNGRGSAGRSTANSDNGKSSYNGIGDRSASGFTRNKSRSAERRDAVAVSDLNTATAEELRSVNGIGEKLSARIVKFRDRLGVFLVDEQLYDVYGLEPEVVERAFERFRVLEKQSVQKININEASVDELAELVYIQRPVAYRIVDYRERNGGIESFDELKNIEDFPSERIPRIALYLSL